MAKIDDASGGFVSLRKPTNECDDGGEKATTDRSSEIGVGSSANSSSSSSSHSRKRRPVESIRCVVVAAVVLLLCVTALAFMIRDGILSPNENLHEDGNGAFDASVLVTIPIPTHTRSSENNPTIHADLAADEDATARRVLRGPHKPHNRRRLDVDAAVEGERTSACDPCEYYKSMASWSRDDLQRLLESTHQPLPYYGGSKNTRDALADLDRGEPTPDGAPTVELLYSNTTVRSRVHVGGSYAGTWNREHVWPCGRGVRCGRNGGEKGPDYTDVHHLFAADVGVNSDRGTKYFEYCNNTSVCKIPKRLRETEHTTMEDPPLCIGEDCDDDDGDIFQPPEEVRGVVARAIFYMDLRYPHLELANVPTKRNQMGNHATLMLWHEHYPPTPAEQRRNDRACSLWQGNRNPFVDVPDLATILYEDDSTIRDGVHPFRNCSSTSTDNIDHTVNDEPDHAEDMDVVDNYSFGNSTSIDNMDSDENQNQSQLVRLPLPGDVMIVGIHSDNPDGVALVALEDLPAGLVIHVTDNAYNGNVFESNEGTMSLTLFERIVAGTVFGYGEGLLYTSSWKTSDMDDTNFDLSVRGDTVIVYATTATEPEDYTILSVVAFAGSGLPESITTEFAVELGNQDNYVYTGDTTVAKASLQNDLVDKTKWTGSNSKTDSSMSQWQWQPLN